MFPPPRSTPIDQAETRFLPALAATARTITLRTQRAFLFHEPRQYGCAQLSDAFQPCALPALSLRLGGRTRRQIGASLRAPSRVRFHSQHGE